MQKKILFLILAFLTIPGLIFAQLQPYAPGAPQVSSLSGLIANIINAIWIIFTVIVVVSFLVAGIAFLTAQGQSEKLKLAKAAFIWGIAGVAVGLLAFGILTIVERILVAGA